MIQVCQVENIKDIYMFTKCLNIHCSYDKTDARVVHRDGHDGVLEQAGEEQHNITEGGAKQAKLGEGG